VTQQRGATVTQQRGVAVTQTLWTDRAANAFGVLQAVYWNGGLFATHSDQWHYWWQAHALDSLVDAFERDRDTKHLEQAGQLLEAIRAQSGGLCNNDFYDDMQWLALSSLRAWQHSQNTVFQDAALELWADIQTGWNAHCGGGIAWKKTQTDYKNTPANAPAVILAARLFAAFGNPADQIWAAEIMEWLEVHLLEPQSKLVWDGMNRLGDGAIDKDWIFTYCQGVGIGAALEVGCVDLARQIAHTAHKYFGKVLPDEGSGDGGLFKGIFVRYLTQYIAQTRDEYSLAWLKHNAELVWQHHAGKPIGGDWAAPSKETISLSQHLSGLMLLEAAARLERLGILC
jgi:predicted alpha-1,6-mannanase (GH76 family)